MENIGKRFEITKLGEATHYLGITIEKDSNGNFENSQSDYNDKIVLEANLENTRESKSPLDIGYYKQVGKELPSNDQYKKLNVSQKTPITVITDNQSCIALIEN